MGQLPNFHDSYLQRGEPLGMTLSQVTLTANNTVLTTAKFSLIQIDSDNATATNRVFTLNTSPLVGHELTLLFVAGSSHKAKLANTGTTKLATDWVPSAQYDMMKLVSDGTNWIEVARTTSSGVSDIALASAHVLVGNASGLAADVAMSGDVTIANTGATAIGAGKVLLAMLGAGITPSHVIVYAGSYTTLGGSATEAQTLNGVAATDIITATLNQKGATPRTLLTTAATLNTITYVFSGDPSTDHKVSYVVHRAAS